MHPLRLSLMLAAALVLPQLPGMVSAAVTISQQEVDAPGWNAASTADTVAGLKVTLGWGYMDSNLLAVVDDTGGPTFYGTLFFPCDIADKTKLFYCARVWRSSDNATTPTLQLGGGGSLKFPASLGNSTEAYQPPMLFRHAGVLLLAFWTQLRSGSALGLASIDRIASFTHHAADMASPAGGDQWKLEGLLSDFEGSFNYLGGAMDQHGGITVAGYHQIGNTHSTLGVAHAAFSSSQQAWSWGALQSAGPTYTDLFFQPLYPQVVHTADGGVHMFATLNSDAPCANSSRPGHVNMGAMYRQLRYYEGRPPAALQAAAQSVENSSPRTMASCCARWTWTEIWRDMTPDARSSPATNGNACDTYSERFPHDLLFDDASNKVFALYMAEDQQNHDNSRPDVNKSWPLLEVALTAATSRKAPSSPSRHVPAPPQVSVLCPDLGAAAFNISAKAEPFRISAMQLSILGDGDGAGTQRYAVVAAVVADPKQGGSATAVTQVWVRTTADFVTFDDPTTVRSDRAATAAGGGSIVLPMPYGLGGNSIKVTQPNKNGGDHLPGALGLWWQGSMVANASVPNSDFMYLRHLFSRIDVERIKDLTMTHSQVAASSDGWPLPAPRGPPSLPCPLRPRITKAHSPPWEVHAFHWDATGQDAGDMAYLNNTPGAWRTAYDWETITTVDVFSNGSVDRGLLCAAHEHGARVVIGSAAAVQPMWKGPAALKDPAYRAALVRAIVANVQREHADGANVDIEWPPDGTKEALTEFVCELGSALRRAVPDAQLSFDMPSLPVTYHTQSLYDYTSLALCVDYFVIMGYDMLTPSMARQNITAANSPLSLVKEGLAEWISTLGIQPHQLVLALPFFGNTFTCLHATAPAGTTSTTGCVPDPPFVVDPDTFGLEVGLDTIVEELLPLSKTGQQGWNESAASPWFDYVNATDGKRRRIWYDNSTSIAAKTQLACDTGLLGVGAWIADALPSWRPAACKQMWDALHRPSVCTRHPPPPPLPPPPLPPPSPPPPSLPVLPGIWTSPPPGAPGIDLFRSGDLGFANFRIPLLLSVPQASQVPTLLVFAEARKYSDSDWGSHGIVLRRSLTGGRSWTTAKQIWSDPPARNLTYETHGHYYQPKAWVDSGGLNGLNLGAAVYDHETSTAILLMAMCSDNCTYFGCRQARSCRAVDPSHPRPHGRPSAHTYGRVFAINSTDGFRTWSQPVEITSQLSASGAIGYPLGLGPGTGVQTKSGRLIVCGAMGIGSNVYYSDTHGHSWKAGGVVEDFGTNECDMVLLANNSVLLTLRSGTGFRIQARSDDEGLSFPYQRKMLDLPDPGCAAGIARRLDGSLWLANNRNPSLKATWRTNMSLSVSTDGGTHWQYHSQVWTCSAPSCPSGYSSLAMVPSWYQAGLTVNTTSDSLALVYERGVPSDMVHQPYFPYSFITFAVINPGKFDLALASVSAASNTADHQPGGEVAPATNQGDTRTDAFETIGQWCHPAGTPIDTAGLFDSHDVVTVGLTLRKLKPSDDHFADFSSLLDAAFEQPIRRVGGSNIESMAQLLNYSSKFRIVEQAVIGGANRGAFEDVLEDAFLWNRNQSRAGLQGLQPPDPSQLVQRYADGLCHSLQSTGRDWWLINATFGGEEPEPGSPASQLYFEMGFAQTIRLLKQTCVLRYGLNLTLGVMLAADSGHSDFIFQNYTTYFPTAGPGATGDITSATAPLVSFVDFFVVRGKATDIDRQTFTYSTAPVPSECSRGDDTVLRELTGLDRLHTIPAGKVIMGTTTVTNAAFDCPPSYPVDQLAPCFPSDQCSVWSGWTAGDLDGNKAAILYGNVANGTVEYRYDNWAQTAYFHSSLSENNCDGVISNCFIELPTAQSYEFRLRHLRWRGARGLFTACADADFAVSDGGSGRHWQQPAEVLHAFKTSEPFVLRLPSWIREADVDLESSADGLCRFFGGRGSSAAGSSTVVTCFGPKPQSTFPFILVGSEETTESTLRGAFSLQNVAAAAGQLALVQLTSKAYANRSGSIFDPQYQREVPINAALAEILALAFNGTVANTSVLIEAAAAGNFMGCAPALTKICTGSPGLDVCCSLASQFCPDYRSMITFNRSAASACDTTGTDAHTIGSNGAMSAVGSLQMYDGGITCQPSDHDGGANCNPRGNLALPAINLLVGLDGGPTINRLNELKDNPFHVTVGAGGGLKTDDADGAAPQKKIDADKYVKLGTRVVFYAAPGGQHTALGATTDEPTSLDAALELARTKSIAPTAAAAPVVVDLLPGRYQLERPISIPSHVTLRGQEDASRVTLSGGVTIFGWAAVTDKPWLYRAMLPAKLHGRTVSQLWVAGQRRSVARSPTMRFNHTLPTGLQVQPGQLLSHYSNVSAIRAIMYQHWTATICQVVSLDATKTKLPSQSLRRSTPGMPSRGRVTIWKTHLNI